MIPSSVLPHDPKRYSAQVIALKSALLYSPEAAQAAGAEKVFMAKAFVSSDAEAQPLTASVVKKALEIVDSGLASPQTGRPRWRKRYDHCKNPVPARTAYFTAHAGDIHQGLPR